MVKVVENLEQFKRNVEHCRIIYKVDEVGPSQYRVGNYYICRVVLLHF